MASNTRYRLASVSGTVAVVLLAFLLANHAAVQAAVTDAVPVLARLRPQVLSGTDAVVSAVICVGAFLVALTPLFKPRPRRVLDTLTLASRRTLSGLLALATLGYFDYSYRLPRATLIVLGLVTFIAVPAWFVALRRRPRDGEARAIVVGDDAQEIHDIIETTDLPLIGFVSPPSAYNVDTDAPPAIADGGHPLGMLPVLGDLRSLGEILVDHDVDTAIFAFSEPSRGEFFTALADCHDHGVDVKVHRNHTDSVLTAPSADGDLVDVDLEPWDWQERIVKRLFDVLFAGFALLCALPVMVVVAVAIKVDSPGPVLYSQERTAEFGETFTVYKFRSMVPESEDVDPGEDEDRVTRVGRFIRSTHLDEIPQLWSILVGDMSVVGPRAAWTDEEEVLEGDVGAWRKRWFVKPGLTGLAQINGVSSEEPEQKLRYDLEYIRKQDFWYDLGIVVRQLWSIWT
ncbi:sugar transferase [Halocalculus aciditolerans]|uniref:Bacterial sugar transferase domain-containing protein n=1 Tax=Halocalculus aciditolerans TaxID=1383812 RepID=A0A830FMT1_9EURY|nr:sugar transferase [Halocalculus aciditolerans]GGL68323.1 hypothetical protein GCM10009039_27860 [Halocalculus aciditolerans]